MVTGRTFQTEVATNIESVGKEKSEFERVLKDSISAGQSTWGKKETRLRKEKKRGAKICGTLEQR